MSLIFNKDFIIDFQNRKWNYPNMKWNHFTYFQASNQKLLSQNVSHLIQRVQNQFSKQEMELSKHEMELFLQLPNFLSKNAAKRSRQHAGKKYWEYAQGHVCFVNEQVPCPHSNVNVLQSFALVVFKWKCYLFCLFVHGQCRVYYIYHVEFHFQCSKFRSALRGIVHSRTILSKLVRFWYAKLPKSGLSLSKTTISG